MKRKETTMGIGIDPEVFNTAKAYSTLRLDALESGAEIKEFAEKLAQAADIHQEGPRAYFQVLDLNDGSNSDHVNDFGIFYQNIIDDSDKIDDKAFLDFSFDVQKDQHHILRSACIVRYDSVLESDPATGEMKFKRPDMAKKIMPTDATDILANDLFMWFFEKMPEDDRRAFLQNCENLGLTEQKMKIGFGTEPGAPQVTASVH